MNTEASYRELVDRGSARDEVGRGVHVRSAVGGEDHPGQAVGGLAHPVDGLELERRIPGIGQQPRGERHGHIMSSRHRKVRPLERVIAHLHPRDSSPSCQLESRGI